ncbi:BHLH domain-containing protein [Aphelenchoides fujianensis]|nr:BHLH domain-containing protein [Aphelenchoides fujianensis]
MDSSERKKQTHLRCERQRREAINNGYNDLKELLPASTSFAGCKTTNASILFRAADYVKQLDETIKAKEKTVNGFASSQAAMCMIIQQYESMGADKPQPVHTQVLKSFLDECFDSFSKEVDMNNYQTMTKSLLMWVEKLPYLEIVEKMLETLETTPAQ